MGSQPQSSWFRITTSVDKSFLRCSAEDSMSQKRMLADADFQLFGQWIARYNKLLNSYNPSKELLKLGKEIADWLNRTYNWLDHILKNCSGAPLVIEFRIPIHHAPTSPTSQAHLSFLEIPWELLSTDGTGFLAANESLLYSPLRRIGEPGKPQPCTDRRLSMVFMAADPARPEGSNQLPANPDHASLDYEAEEQAIFTATGNIELDLLVEESGNLAQLTETAAQLEDLHILHLSCHGNIDRERKQAYLQLENVTGGPELVNPSSYAHEFGSVLRPRLLFLSACKSSATTTITTSTATTTTGATSQETSQELLNSYSASLVRRGWPAVLGWSGSVRDKDATRFAAALYKQLSRKNSRISTAIAYARAELLRGKGTEQPTQQPPQQTVCQSQESQDWHLARLYYSAQGGGIFCGGSKALRTSHRDTGSKEYNTKAFLDAKQQIPVASRWEFVGRRRQLQQAIHSLRSRQSAGLLIHGMGRQGKSSLAARIANRMNALYGYRPAVVFGSYDAHAILAAIREALPSRKVNGIINNYKEVLETEPEQLRFALTEIFHLIEQGEDSSIAPLLLIIDDFEQALVRQQAIPFPVHPDVAPAITPLLKAFRDAPISCKLLFTSRYTFSLPEESTGADLNDPAKELFSLPLAAMNPAERRKQAKAKARLRNVPLEELHRQRTEAILHLCQGNPGLQDMLFRLELEIHSPTSNPAGPADPASATRLETLLAEMQRFNDSGQAPEQAELVRFFEQLTIKALFDLLKPSERETLRIATLFSLPVPGTVLQHAAEQCGYNADGAEFGRRLISLGLLEAHRDELQQAADRPPATSMTGTLQCNRLAAQFLPPLSEQEQQQLAALTLEPLFQAWHGSKPSVQTESERPPVCNWELARLAILAGDAVPEIRCTVLQATVPSALDFLDRQFLYKAASQLAAKTLAILEEQSTAISFALYHAAGKALHQTGDNELALHCFTGAANHFPTDAQNSSGQQRFEHASTLLSLANLYQQRGMLSQAEESFQLARNLFEALGMNRDKAIALGGIARIMVDKGQIEQALNMHQERRQIFEELGDKRSRAVTLGDIARIMAKQGQIEQALNMHQEMIQIFEELGDKRERAVTLGDIARIMVDKGQIEQALTLQEERLQINTTLDDLDGIAAALFDIAQIELQQEQYQQAFENLTKSYSIFTKIGRLDFICHVGISLGGLLVMAGQREEGVKILQRSYDGFVTLGQPHMAEQVAGLLQQIQSMNKPE